MTPVPLAPEVVTGMINLRGQIVCAIDLRRRLQLPDRAADQTPMSVVVRTNQGTVSLLVDEIGDVIDVTAEALERPPETLQGVAREVIEGVYKLPDRLLLALDVNRVVEVGERSEPAD
jgi:purine-binding chemotaxis protein CheW